MKPDCPRCLISLSDNGWALITDNGGYDGRHNWPDPNPKLVTCYKCHLCGHSDDGRVKKISYFDKSSLSLV